MPPEENGKEKRKVLARERTDWALHRTMLAKERTFSAWLRTGLAAIVSGVGIARFLGDFRRPEITKIIGGLLVFIGGILFIIALWRYRHGYKELKGEGMRVASFWSLSSLVVLLLTVTGLAFFLVLYL